MTPIEYPDPAAQLLTLGDVGDGQAWPDYMALGLSLEDVPALVRMIQDDELHWAASDSAEVWAPLHAWRVLCLLQAEEALEPLLALFVRADVYDDDWVGDDLPEALGHFGPTAVPALRAYLSGPSQGLWASRAAANSLAEIGQRHPQVREACVEALSAHLARFAELHPDVNAYTVGALVKLKAKEAAPLIEKAFASERVELGLLGDWEDVQVSLGLLKARHSPPLRHYFLAPEKPVPAPQQRETRPGRNDPCWCGSGKKYKHCHWRADQEG